MKTFNRKISSLISKLCAACLAVLGYSCSSSSSDIPLMYGMPVGDFEIKGSVTDEDGDAVENAEIRVTYAEAPSGLYSPFRTRTDEKGKYQIEERLWRSELKVVCVPNNSTNEADSVIVKLDYKHDGIHEDKDAWYEGFAEETVNFKLKKKEQPE
ncbi:MAG: radical SAM-associated putative lipoprotein [Muribaculaceae bacterium]|nr:radical SAM-associated putative lipoprotein [Muribaculaceae bacterium]